LINYLKLYISLLCFAIIGFYCLPANAYVLQGPHILELMTGKYGKAKTLLVSQRQILYNNGPETKTVELDETLRYIFPEEFRSDIRSENIQKLHIISKGQMMTVIDGKITATSESIFEHYKDIILYRCRELLQHQLHLLGIDVSIASLGRFHGKTAYVLGAQYPDESVSQVWIDKDTFLPFRLILSKNSDAAHKDSMELRYNKWRNIDNTWYPMHIECYQNDFLAREIIADDIKINLDFPKDLFDIKELQSIYLQNSRVAPKQPESDGLSEINKTIEKFKKIYR
jgi:outer membrane lipoprotein-sorting protein